MRQACQLRCSGSGETRTPIGELPLHRIAWILLVLVVFGWVAAELPSQVPNDPPQPATVWRHTRNGWEHQDHVLVRPIHEPPLHPVVIAALEVLLTMTAMLAVGRD
jgi:hypothetical protein